MRHTIIAVLAAFLLTALAGTAVAGPYEDGKSAYERFDFAEAERLHRRAAEQGHAKAQFSLGTMYQQGFGVPFDVLPQDYVEAANWYRKAAEQGHAEAQNNLGLMYGIGQGVQQNYVQAHMWYNLAGAQGLEQAAKNRDNVAKRMTPAQIAEAQKLAREWKPK